MKKKLICLIAASLLIFSLTACNTGNSDNDANTDTQPPADNDMDLSGMEVETEEEPDVKILNVYHLDKEKEDILSETTLFEQNEKLTETEILEQLAEYGVIDASVSHNTSQEAIDDNKKSIMTLDLSQDFAEYLSGLDSETEALTLQCVANTFIDYYHMDALIITTDGKALVTDHAEYNEALAYKDIN